VSCVVCRVCTHANGAFGLLGGNDALLDFVQDDLCRLQKHLHPHTTRTEENRRESHVSSEPRPTSNTGRRHRGAAAAARQVCGWGGAVRTASTFSPVLADTSEKQSMPLSRANCSPSSQEISRRSSISAVPPSHHHQQTKKHVIVVVRHAHAHAHARTTAHTRTRTRTHVYATQHTRARMKAAWRPCNQKTR